MFPWPFDYFISGSPSNVSLLQGPSPLTPYIFFLFLILTASVFSWAFASDSTHFSCYYILSDLPITNKNVWNG